MKIEVGKFYRARGGAKAQILVQYPEQVENHFIGVVTNTSSTREEMIPMSWEKTGKVYEGHMDYTEWDLVAPWEDPEPEEPRLEGWVNVYPDMIHEMNVNGVLLRSNKITAEAFALNRRIRCVRMREVRYKKKK